MDHVLMDRKQAGPTSLESAGRAVLEHVGSEGPLPAAMVPHRWPVTGHHLRLVVADLTRQGLLRAVRRPPARQPLVSLTPRGIAALDDPSAD